MPSFQFKIKFMLPDGNSISTDERVISLELPLDDHTIKFQLKQLPNTGYPSSFIFIGTGFKTEKEAFTAGIKIKNTLMLCSIKLPFGIDLGKDNTTAGFVKDVIESRLEEGVNLINDVHGLTVYQSDLPVEHVLGGNSSLCLAYSANSFYREFESAYKYTVVFNDKLNLALELYNQSYFELTMRARFLTLISVIECLTEPDKESEKIISLLDGFIETIKTTEKDVSLDERNAICNRLGNLKRESISSACRNLIRKYIGEEFVKRFTFLYGLRSELVHNGKLPEGTNLGDVLQELENIASNVIYNSLISTTQ